MRRPLAPLALAIVSGCFYIPPAKFLAAWDKDGDGWPGVESESYLKDCDDEDDEVHPGAYDVRGDGCDVDCGLEPDADGDDWPDGSDCDPDDPLVYPCSSHEVEGDDLDSDCDGLDGIRWVDCPTASPRFPEVEPPPPGDCGGDGGEARGDPPDTDTDETGDTDTDETGDTDTDTETGDTDTETGDTDTETGDTEPDPGVAVDSCGDALSASPVGAGAYTGDMTGFGADFDAVCATGGTPGPEGFVSVQVPEFSTLVATGTLVGADASLVLLPDCTDAGTCDATANATGSDGTETIRWVNADASAQTRFLVLDSVAADTPLGAYTLDVSIEAPADASGVFVDTCAEAQSVTPAGSGSWKGNLSTFADDLDVPQDGTVPSCGHATPGEDAMAPVVLTTGQTLDARLFQQGGTGGILYLVSDCDFASTCAASTAPSDDPDMLTYTNTSGSDQLWYLVLDAEGTGVSDAFVVTVSIY